LDPPEMSQRNAALKIILKRKDNFEILKILNKVLSTITVNSVQYPDPTFIQLSQSVIGTKVLRVFILAIQSHIPSTLGQVV
jgi:hypothetical protein